MAERNLLRPRSLWLCAIFLLFADPTASSATGKKVSSQQRDQTSSITLHVPLPVLALSEIYNGIHRDGDSPRNMTHEWIPLGGGTGFLKYRIWPGDQDARTVNGRLISHTTFPFGVEYAKPINGTLTKVADCGQSDATGRTGRMSVQLVTTFTQGRGYGIAPKSTVAAIEPAGSCMLSDQNVDAAPLLAQVYRSELQRVLPSVDRKSIGLVSLKPAVSRIWKELQEPILLDEKESVWLLVKPESVGAAGVGTLSEVPAAAFGVTARPTVVRGTKPVSPPSPLPDAQDRFHDDGFHVTFTLQVPMEEANQRLREAVVGQEWSLGVGTIKIAGATLYPLGDQVGVELTLRGLLPLTLLLKGTPAYDEPTGKIRFREVDYTIKARTPATDLAEEWLHQPLRDELARRLVFPIREELDLMRKELEKGLNRNMTHGRLSGTVQQLLLKDLAVEANGLSATFKTDGALLYEAHGDGMGP